MKPDWLNNSPMTNVEVATESSYIRCLAVPTLIERSDGQGIYCDISPLNGDCLHGDAERL